MSGLLAVLLRAASTLLGGWGGGVLGYIVAAYVSLWIWPDLRKSNLAGLPAVFFGFLPGLAAGAVAGWWVSGRLTRKPATAAAPGKQDIARDERSV